MSRAEKLNMMRKFDQIALRRKREGVMKKVDYAREKILAQILSELKPEIALDIACGSGRYFEVIRKECNEYIGLDISSTSLRIAKDFHGGAVIQGDAENLPFKSATFDFVSFINALCHFKEPLRPISEVHKILCPKGYCILEVLNKKSIGYITYRAFAIFSRFAVTKRLCKVFNIYWVDYPPFFQGYDIKDISKKIEKVGFQIERVVQVSPFKLIQLFTNFSEIYLYILSKNEDSSSTI